MRLNFEREDLLPLVQEVVGEVLRQIDESRQQLGDQLALSEAEAAAKLGLRKHQLRDARLRKELAASRLGKAWFYETSELVAWLRRKRTSD
jgi:hypothetical protein